MSEQRATRQAPTWLVPEVIQSSAMDCGPAALASVLAGFGIDVSLGRLREACQTDVDGTSIDTLEDVAVALGLQAEQVVVPVDHVLRESSRSLPAIAVVTLPNGVTHFVVLWRVVGPFVQVMDPGSGRVWIRRDKLLEQLYVHGMPVGAADWREFAGGDEFLPVLRERMGELGCSASFCSAQLDAALADVSHRSLSRLDAGVRMLADIVGSGGLVRGAEVERALVSLLDEVARNPAWIPEQFWSAGSTHALDDDRDAEGHESRNGELEDEAEHEAEHEVLLRGAVLVRVLGHAQVQTETEAGDDVDAAPVLPAALAAVHGERQPSFMRELGRLVLADGWASISLVCVAVFAASVGVLLEAAILRGMVELGVQLGLVRERLVAWSALLLFAIVLMLLEVAIAGQVRGIGRRLETRLRVAFLSKVPRLGARYFQSRLSSDMAERIHAMHGLRRLPSLAGELLRTGFSLVLTVIGIAWLDPGGAAVAAIGASASLLAAALALPSLRERDLRFRSHGGALSRVYLDALLGLWPVRAHGAARAVRREHEQLLVEWMRAGLDLVRASVSVDVLQGLVGFAVVIAVVARHTLGAGEVGAMLLLIYWSLQLPALGQQIGTLLRQVPGHRSRALRLLEPLGAPDEDTLGPAGAVAALDDPIGTRGAIALRFRDVAVVAAGHELLHDIDVDIAAGEHVAIVGASGAGKSTLVGALLGWHQVARGQILVAGAPLEGRRLAALRRRMAWVDPAIALWNEALVDNLLYGSPTLALDRIGATLADAELLELVANLPEGLQTELGEGGALLSGGEGQRVRLGRALLRPDIGLVILDEPLRGLDRGRRAALLRRLRERWADATLLCVTHDLDETLEFPRVLVIDDGAIVQDGPPRELAAQADGAYARMLERERSVHALMWNRPQWRRVSLRGGQIVESGGPSA